MAGYPPNEYTWYDIDAKIGRDATEDDVRVMFQSLLADRFKLRTHRETRDLPEYEVVMAKDKAKLTPASAEERMKVDFEGRRFTWPKGDCGVTLWTEGSRLICHAATIDKIVASIGNEKRGPIVDHTGLSGTYDVNLLFTSEHSKPRTDDGPPAAPLLEEALRSELGLKVQRTKGPVEVVVIDRAEKPTVN